MGNEASSQEGRPPTILVIEAVLWPSTTVVFCRVSLREKHSNEDKLLGEVKRFPGRPLAVHPRHISSILVLSFRAADGANAGKADMSGDPELASLCVPISSLVQWGAPLFTSLWFGLQEGRMETGFESALKYAKSPKVPKVRVAFFRPSMKSYKELELRKDDDDGGKSRLEAIDPARGTQAEPDIFAALATDVDGVGRVGWDNCPSLTQQMLGIVRAVKASNETVWALQTALFNLAALPQQTLRSTPRLTRDVANGQEMRYGARARIRVTISEYRGLQNMCCMCEVPGYADLEFKMWHHGSSGAAPLSGPGSNLVVGPYDYAECEAYPVGQPLRFAGKILGPGSEQEAPFAWFDLEGDAFYPYGYRGDLMLLDANGGARGTVNVRIDVIADDPEQCKGEIPFNDKTCQFEADAASADLSVMLAKEGLDVVLERVNETMLGDFAKKWGKSKSLMSALWPAKSTKAETKMKMLPLPSPVKIDPSRSGAGASQDKRQSDWDLVKAELVEYLAALNSMLESVGTSMQLHETDQQAACIIVTWQPQTLSAARAEQRDGETDPQILHRRIEEQQQAFSEEIMKLRRQHTESVLAASRNLGVVREELLQHNTNLKEDNGRLQAELHSLRMQEDPSTHVRRSLDQAAADLEASVNREKVHVQRYELLEAKHAELEEKHSQQAANIVELRRLKEVAEKDAADRETAVLEMRAIITETAEHESFLSQRLAQLEAADKGSRDLDARVQSFEQALAESTDRETALRDALAQADQREVALQHALNNTTQREATLQERHLQLTREEVANAANNKQEIEALKVALEQAKGREAELLQRMRTSSDETSKTWQVALREAAERESALREAAQREATELANLRAAVDQSAQREAAWKAAVDEAGLAAQRDAAEIANLRAAVDQAVQREAAWRAALDEASERENALSQALEQGTEREATEMANLKAVALQEVTGALRDLEEKDAALQEVVSSHANLEEQLRIEQSLKEDALKKAESTLSEVSQNELARNELMQALAQKDADLKQALQKEIAVLEELEQREADLQQMRMTAVDLQEKLRQAGEFGSTRDAEAERKEIAFREALAQKEADLEQVLAREASLHAALNSQRIDPDEALNKAGYKQMAQEAQQEVTRLQEELEEQRAAALFHKQAAVRGTEEIAIKADQLKEAAKDKAYLKEAAEREATLKDVALEEVALKERELKEERQLVADLQAQFQQAADREKDREVEEKWKELQRQLQGSQKELQKSREAQFHLEEQLVATEAQQAKLRAELQVKQDIEAHKEELIAKVRMLEAEIAKTNAGLQGSALQPPKSMPDVATLHLQAELDSMKQQVEEAEGSERMLQDAKYSAIFMELVKTRQDLEFERSKSAQSEGQADLAQTQEVHRQELEMLKRQLDKERASSHGELVLGHQNELRDLERRQDETIQLLERRSQAVLCRFKSRFAEVMRLQSKGATEQTTDLRQQIIAQLQAGLDDCQEAMAAPLISAGNADADLKSTEPVAATLRPVSTTPPVNIATAAPAIARTLPGTAAVQTLSGTPNQPAGSLMPFSQRAATPTSTHQVAPASPQRSVAAASLATRSMSPQRRGSSVTAMLTSPAPFNQVKPSLVVQGPVATTATLSPPATFDCAPRVQAGPRRTSYTVTQTALSSPHSPGTEVKKATVRCMQCNALNMIQLDGPPTIQCGGCGFEFQVDPKRVNVGT